MIAMLRLVGVRALLVAVVAAVLADLAGITLIGAAAWLLVRAAQRPELTALSLGIAGVRAAAVVRGFARYGERLSGHDAALGALARLRDRVYRTLAGQPPTRRRSAGVLGAVVHDVDAVQDLVVRCVLPFTSAIVVSCVSVTAVWLLSPAGPVLAVGVSSCVVLVPLLAGLRSSRSDRLIAAERAELTAGTVDLFRGAAELAVTGTGASARADVSRAAARLAARQRSAPAHGATAAVLMIAGCTMAGCLLTGITSPILAAVVALVVLATFEVCLPLPAAARQLARVAGSVRRLGELTDGPAAAHENDMPPTGTELVLRNVSVHYGETPALLDVDLTLPPGRRLAVVGMSGSGKSTLLATIARFAEPTAGMISLGGKGLARWPDDALRRTVGGVLLDTHVFHDSIAANLRIGDPDATDADLAAVAARMRLLPWVESLPDGWQTVLGEDAAFASGGQRQRLLLARALLANPPVLLLDEPTEGLDADTADAVLADLLSAADGHSVVLVTHRLTGLAAFDEVVMLDGGRVVQRGHHTDLATSPGPYRDLWQVRELVG